VNHSYSVNGLLRNLAQNLEFKVFIFDDPQFGPEIKLRERSKKGEIDAVLLFKNVIFLNRLSTFRFRNSPSPFPLEHDIKIHEKTHEITVSLLIC